MASWIHSGILGKFKQAFRRGNARAKRAEEADFLVKMNLAPLMGRRDAALDRALELLDGDIFSMDDQKREKKYSTVLSLLDCALADTESIVLTLSNQDLVHREKRIAYLIEMLRTLSETAHHLAMLVRQAANDEVLNLAGPAKKRRFHLDEVEILDGETKIIHNLKELISWSATPLNRYRTYGAQSFSQHNLERYNSALKEYRELYSSW